MLRFDERKKEYGLTRTLSGCNSLLDKSFTPKVLEIYLVGDDSLFPWRWKIRPPGFINLQILPQLVKKMKLADIMTILGSIDIIMGEVDR